MGEFNSLRHELFELASSKKDAKILFVFHGARKEKNDREKKRSTEKIKEINIKRADADLGEIPSSVVEIAHGFIDLDKLREAEGNLKVRYSVIDPKRPSGQQLGIIYWTAEKKLHEYERADQRSRHVTSNRKH